MLYMVTFTTNIPPMLVYIPAPWILWVMLNYLGIGYCLVVLHRSGFLRFEGSLPHGQAAKVTTNTSTSVNPATKPFICIGV